MRILQNIFFGLFITLLFGIAVLFLFPFLPIERNIDLKIVESGSMEPAIKTGSLVLIAPSASYQVGEVITFKSSGADVPITHRIENIYQENGSLWYTTKGDANEEADTSVVPHASIIGKVWVALPYAGYVLDFARQPLGFGFLIVLPALLIILGEFEKIWHEIRKGTVRRKPQKVVVPVREEESNVRAIIRMIEIGCPVVSYEPLVPTRRLTVQSITHDPGANRPFTGALASLAVVLGSSVIASFTLVGSTVSYFNDTEASLENMLTAVALDLTLEQDGSLYNFIGTQLQENPVNVEAPIPVPGSAEVYYEIETEVIAGDLPFCEAIVADASSPVSFIGPLIDLSAIGVAVTDPWDLSLSLSAPFTNGELCEIDIVYTAWHAEAALGEGYHDEERISLMFQAPLELIPLQLQSYELLVSTPQEDLQTQEVEIDLQEKEANIVPQEEPLLILDEVMPDPEDEEVEEIEVDEQKEEIKIEETEAPKESEEAEV